MYSRKSLQIAYGCLRKEPIVLTKVRALNCKGMSTAALAEVQTETLRTPYQLYTKSDIPFLFRRYAPHLDPAPYYAAANVFPMRVTNYVAENHIDW